MSHKFRIGEIKTALTRSWQLAWPVIIANLSLPLLGLADASVLGRLESSVYLAAVTAGGSIMAYFFWGFNFLSMGLSGFTSQHYGGKNHHALRLTLNRYFQVAAVLIVIVLCLKPWIVDLGVWLISPSSEVATEMAVYLQIRLWGVPALILNMMLIGFFIGMQNTRISLYSVSLTQLLNIGLNIFFVFGLGFKTEGIAIGTVISEYLGLALILWHLQRTLKKFPDQTKQTSSQSSWQLKDYLPIFHISSHLFLRSFFMLSTFLWLNRQAAAYGEVVLAVNGILLALCTLISNFLDGVSDAAESQTGFYLGEKDGRRLRLVWLSCLLLIVSLSLLMTLVLGLFGQSFIEWMARQEDVRLLAVELLPLVVLVPLSSALAFLLDGIFVGARLSQAMRNGVVAAALTFFILSQFFASSANELWLALHAFYLVRILWLGFVFMTRLWPKSGKFVT